MTEQQNNNCRDGEKLILEGARDQDPVHIEHFNSQAILNDRALVSRINLATTLETVTIFAWNGTV